MQILVDADALVALAKEDDTNHQKAIKIAQKLKSDVLFASCFAIPEAATVLSHRVSQKAAGEFLKNVRQRKINIIYLNSELEKMADQIFLAQKTKGISWPDCFNMAMVQKFSLEAIFSFDKIYKKNGFTTVTA
ncbi:type II toxin-antitoxin system VapC family toxin [Candidatus Gottesmanbacteria bacterium]|nr:type II toxin-antitoxin system VapC family toxin [Candidatus Gottesmanbacteria bacterium]